LDLDLSDITGIDAARVIKKNPTTANIPIVALLRFERMGMA
jgi:CheY-like chemotaxis protein